MGSNRVTPPTSGQPTAQSQGSTSQNGITPTVNGLSQESTSHNGVTSTISDQPTALNEESTNRNGVTSPVSDQPTALNQESRNRNGVTPPVFDQTRAATLTPQDLQDLSGGDLVWFREQSLRGWWKYLHWAVYLGHGVIVHVQEAEKGHIILLDTLEDYMKRNKRRCSVRRHIAKRKSRPADEVIECAIACVGQAFKYHPIFNNCEHFAKWCKYGKRSSRQVNAGMAIGGMGVGAVAGGCVGIGVGLGVGLGSVVAISVGGMVGGILVIAGVCTLLWMAHKVQQNDEKDLSNTDTSDNL